MFSRLVTTLKQHRIRSIAALAGSATGAYAYNQYQPIGIVWDLDHTLVHTSKAIENAEDTENTVDDFDFAMKFTYGNHDSHWNVWARPGARQLIHFFDMFPNKQFVFTAAVRPYADGLIDGLNIKNVIDHSISRNEVTINEEALVDYFVEMFQEDIDAFDRTGDMADLEIWKNPELVVMLIKQRLDLRSDEVQEKLRLFINTKYRKGRRQTMTMKRCGKDVMQFSDQGRCSKNRIILIDDKRSAHITHESTGLLVPPYYADKNPNDFHLLGIAWVLFKCMFSDDIEGVIRNSDYAVKKKE